MSDDLITVYVDEQPIEVPKGTNMVEVAAMAGKEVPHYCYHPKLSVAGNCRMCLVEMGMPGRDRATGEPMLNEDGSPKIMWMPKPAIACATNAAPGMHIKTESPMVEDCRNGIMEFLLVNHPLDCPICDQAGECRLQEFATHYGRGYSRFVEEKNLKPKRTRLGPRVMLDDERCILCSRCIRFSQEVAKDDVLGFVDRGSYSTLTCYPGKQLENNYSLNTVDICPVGALTSTDFRFKMRVWFLKETKSICTESSVGVNTEIGSREGKIYRVTPRRNDAVNDTWMADSGRALYKQVEAEDRLLQARHDGEACASELALNAAGRSLPVGRAAIIASGRQTVEEQYLLGKIAAALPKARTYLVAHIGVGDGLLISADRTPNVRGALLTGLSDELPKGDVGDLGQLIDDGEIQSVLCYGEDLTAVGLTEEQLAKVHVVYLGTQSNATSAAAKTVVPSLTVFEKSGTFVNQQFRLQKFEQAVPGARGVFPDLHTLTKLLSLVRGDPQLTPTVDAVWAEMASEIAEFSGLSYRGLDWQGQTLNAARFDGLPFIEGESLHYAPEKELATAG